MDPSESLERQLAGISIAGNPAGANYTQPTAYGSARQHNGNQSANIINNNHGPTSTAGPADPNVNDKLLRAAASGHINQVQFLIRQKNADMDYSDPNGLTAVHWAALSGHEDVLEGLIREGAGLDAVSSKYGTPLCLAVLKGHKKIIQVLLDRRAQPIIAENKLGSAIHCAAWGGDLDILRLLLNHAQQSYDQSFQTFVNHECASGGVEDFEAADALAKAIAGLRVGNHNRTGQQPARKADVDAQVSEYSRCTPLSVAASGGKAKTVSWLVEQGASVNLIAAQTTANTSLGLTPLSAAAQCGNPHILATLINHGASLQWPDSDGSMALRALLDGDCASAAPQFGQDYAACARMLISLGANSSLLTHDEQSALSSILPELAVGGDPNPWDRDWTDADDEEDIQLNFHAAATKGRTELVIKLIRRGADVNDSDGDGRTALMDAVENEHRTTVEAILNTRDYIIDAVDDMYDTALAVACEAGESGSVALVELLLEWDADPNKAPAAFEGPLFTVCRSGNEEIARLLLRWGADKNERLDYGFQDDKTPLHEASEYGSGRVIRVLLDAGADINSLDRDGRSPLSYAVQYGQEAAVSILLSAGADPYAAKENHTTIATFETRNALGWIQEHGNISGIASAVAFGEVEILLLFHNFGVDLQHYALGMPMLNLAVICGQLEVTRFLIEQGADIGSRGDQGQTPYDLALGLIEGDGDEIRTLLTAEMARRQRLENEAKQYFPESHLQPWPETQNQISSQPARPNLGQVVVIHPFWPQSPEQLELQVGDRVDLTKELANGWWRGMSVRTCLEGIFHENHVDTTAPEATNSPERPRQLRHAFTSPLPISTYQAPISAPPILQAVVVSPYYAINPHTLELHTNDTIDVLEYIDQNWWKGRSCTTGNEGMFPCIHVQTIPRHDLLVSYRLYDQR